MTALKILFAVVLCAFNVGAFAGDVWLLPTAYARTMFVAENLLQFSSPEVRRIWSSPIPVQSGH